jgi:hypothetical protein
VINPATYSFVVERCRERAEIYFGSEDRKRVYLDVPVEHPDRDLPNLDNPARWARSVR